MSEKVEKKSRFTARETRFEGHYARTVMNTIFQGYRPILSATIAYLGLGLLGRLVLLGNTNLVGYWVDSFCVAPAMCRPLPQWLAGFDNAGFVWLLALATLLGFALTLIFRVGLSRASADSVSRIYDETTLRTSRLPMSFFDRNPSGRVITRFASDYSSVFRIFGGPLAEFIGLIFDLVAMTILISVASLWFLPFWILLGALNYGVYRWHLEGLRKERRELALLRSPGIAHFSETSAGAQTIRAFNKEGVFRERFEKLNDKYLSQKLRSVSVLARFSFSMSAVTALTFLFTAAASLWLLQRGQLSVGAVGVAFAYLGLSSNVLQSFFEWLAQFEEAMTGLERMNEYLRLPLEPGQRLPASATFHTGHPRERRAGGFRWEGRGASLEIKDLWMRYRPDLPEVLKGVDLSLAAGERVAVVGRTGSGKTSLVQAIFRLYPLQRGEVKIGGYSANVSETGEGAGLGLSHFRSLLSYITQDATLFVGTLRENLEAPGAEPGPRDAELVQALRKVQFLKEEATTKEYLFWLNYQVEEKGRNLSAGERQLVCVARCLLQNAPVVILDEATSAVDPQSEEILTRATDTFFAGKTQLVIAHRLSTVRSCDRILWLQDGRVHRLGRPEDVLPEFERADLLL